HLLQLSRNRILVAEEDVLRDLLGDGRTANRPRTRTQLADVIEYRIESAGQVDATVGPECLVFGRGVGVDQLARKILELQLDPSLARESMDDFPIGPAHDRREWGLVLE